MSSRVLVLTMKVPLGDVRPPGKQVGSWTGKWNPGDRVWFKADGCALGEYGGQGLGAGSYLVVPVDWYPLGKQGMLWARNGDQGV